MAKKFKINIVTADGKKLTDEAEILNVVISTGSIGIMANHLPLIAVIEISHLNYKKDGKIQEYAISGGILNVKKDEVSILADSFEAKEEIDYERAEKAKLRAEERLSSKEPNIDIKKAELSLKRALNRLTMR